MKLRPIAIHLPQFHPFPENDNWWGKGFTEWTNVTKARPLYEGHYQPHLPTDLGFYDLRLADCRLEQEKLAKEYGFYGFCYYHYWFNGKLLMERPIEEKLKNLEEDFPFMLCWANENWTRVWDGGEKNVLMEQDYNMEDHIAHIRYLIPFFKDKRYIKIDGKAAFAVYRTTKIPNFDKVAEIWREEARKHDVELYITRFESFGERGEKYMSENIDASIEFQPHSGVKILSDSRRQEYLIKKQNYKTLRNEISLATIKQSYDHWSKKLKFKKTVGQEKPSGDIIEYSDFIETDITYDKADKINYKFYRCACPGFDNTARRSKDYLILKDSTPELFKHWIKEKLKLFKPYSKEENLFFINAWNEWAEGNYLEPSRKWGRAYLEVIKDIFK
ncbi:glycosyl hydrolase [Chryseobacterium piperi]|uniref:Glycosyl hydrolase n=1 Tax=Chryseobacterium piperi TaxID=558152 RepID=A0A086BMU8_9FLAO|nr:glycoside hydrolase family 99-like domain-containing protein [Chryseobacterium piperi]ASW75056.1 glycosyl hydrolase [Chryseobacterium piperi]KFF30262.1 glycosyl hydrolase [Chryseobacterium piperi]